tara:strand:- start:1138 stop:1797 length:660 start_codon:yes stop_codon:yes gene_type:complete
MDSQLKLILDVKNQHIQIDSTQNINIKDAKPFFDLFRWEHYLYINQILGDRTIREIIMEEFPHTGDFKLRTIKAGRGFRGGDHHIVKKGRLNEYCSVQFGIQNVIEHPFDTLCQSYSMAYYFGLITKHQRKLTRSIQLSMIRKWREILANENIKEQIIFATVHKKKGKYTQELPDTLRNSNIILKIHDVLNKWEKYGWIVFELDPKIGIFFGYSSNDFK